ncbi:hypothetical protein QNA08_06910 [Chelatococcus sp. SYSU_G07232]|uniref:Uncharacterized protein n=1 Tax=Chelatococcus albus TaxID=3047466 RepID=A0ABT7AF19_9HYPH|nr:hypothetical protein [Chelatococcus sp. SYSU_G07232]MDJ1157962.1 hypothetical protein [Chelatococcus sp. SYSU_G07232]
MNLRSLVLAVATAASALAASGAAQAQWYPSPGYDDGYYERRYYRERPRYDYDDDYYYERRYYRPRARFGSMCVTARGNCPASGYVGASCSCYIPGFGPKRGNIVR